MTLHEPTVRPVQRALPAAAAAGSAAFAAQTVFQILAPPQSQPFTSPSDYAIEILFTTGLAVITVGVVLMHRWHTATPRWGRLGAVACAVTAFGTGLLTVTTTATALAGRNVLDVAFVVGLLAWVLGSVLLAVAAFRAKSVPRPLAVLIGAAVPLATLIDEPAGPVVVAVLWGAIAWHTRR